MCYIENMKITKNTAKILCWTILIVAVIYFTFFIFFGGLWALEVYSSLEQIVILGTQILPIILPIVGLVMLKKEVENGYKVFFVGVFLPLIIYFGPRYIIQVRYDNKVAIAREHFNASNKIFDDQHCTKVIDRGDYSFKRCDDGDIRIEQKYKQQYFRDKAEFAKVMKIMRTQENTNPISLCLYYGFTLYPAGSGKRLCGLDDAGIWPVLPEGWSYTSSTSTIETREYAFSVQNDHLYLNCKTSEDIDDFCINPETNQSPYDYLEERWPYLD
jgi:hypothetical protein